MFRFIRRAFPKMLVIITIIIAFIFLALFALTGLLVQMSLVDCGEEGGYENEDGNCEYD